MAEEGEVFSVGDRVVVDGLANATHLNRRHGCVARAVDERGRCAVDLDLDPSQTRVNVRTSNLSREPPIPQELENERAGVEGDGILEEKHGRAISLTLDAMRYIAGEYFMSDPEVQSMADIERLRQGGPAGLLKINYLMALGWSNWSADERGGGRKPTDSSGGRNTMYQCLVEYLQKTVPEGIEEAGEELPPELRFASQALDLPHATGGWHLRVHGDFWVVGSDKENSTGTYLVPTGNTGLVYKVLGVRSAIFPMVEQTFGDVPVVMTITIIPWFGRLVYDGVLAPGGDRVVRGVPQVASKSTAKKLVAAVKQAEEEGRVIDRLRELEVPGGTRVSIDTPVTRATSNEQSGEEFTPDEAEQAPVTPEEQRLVDRVRRLTPFADQDTRGYWVYRRAGYTEAENPAYMGLVIQGSGTMLGPFQCSALDPPPLEILKSIVEYSERMRRRPCILGLDGKTSYERIKFLLKDIQGTNVDYYRPPSREEEDAATSMPPQYY